MFLSSSCTFSSTSIQLTTFKGFFFVFWFMKLDWSFEIEIMNQFLYLWVFPSFQLLLNSAKRRYTPQALECAYLKTCFRRYRQGLSGTFLCTQRFRILIHRSASLHNRQRLDHPRQAGLTNQQPYILVQKVGTPLISLKQKLFFRTSSSRSFSFPLKNRWSNAKWMDFINLLGTTCLLSVAAQRASIPCARKF